jgi:hypothetical protein
MVLWRLANALLRVRHHAFKTPMDISRKQALCLSTTDYFDELEPGNVKPAPQPESNIFAKPTRRQRRTYFLGYTMHRSS